MTYIQFILSTIESESIISFLEEAYYCYYYYYYTC